MVCGLEGPAILIGANLGYIISKIFHQDKQDYFFIGASACTGAILKAPISGALFCAELPYNNHLRYKSLIPSLIASTVAYLIFCQRHIHSPEQRSTPTDMYAIINEIGSQFRLGLFQCCRYRIEDCSNRSLERFANFLTRYDDFPRFLLLPENL